MWLLLLLLLIGCERPELPKDYMWTVVLPEGGADVEIVQKQLDLIAMRGWKVWDDDDIQEKGDYQVYYKYMLKIEAEQEMDWWISRGYPFEAMEKVIKHD